MCFSEYAESAANQAAEANLQNPEYARSVPLLSSQNDQSFQDFKEAANRALAADFLEEVISNLLNSATELYNAYNHGGQGALFARNQALKEEGNNPFNLTPMVSRSETGQHLLGPNVEFGGNLVFLWISTNGKILKAGLHNQTLYY